MRKHTLETFDFHPRIAHSPSGCWEWQQKRSPRGYGIVKFRGRSIGAHRLAWMKYRGDIPANFYVMHACDNPSCVNPNHLFIGTPRDNVLDMISKNRHCHGDKHWMRTHPERILRGLNHPLVKNPSRAARGANHGRYRNPHKTGIGEANGNSKLTANVVQEIKHRLAGGEKQRDIAKSVGISQTQVWRVKTGLAWNPNVPI